MTSHTSDASLPDDAWSALADGALEDRYIDDALRLLASDPQARGRWHACHVAGDVLRSAELADCAGDLAFLQKFEQRLALEPVPTRVAAVVPSPALTGRPAANGDVFRWKMGAGLACLVAVAAIGWQGWQGGGAVSGSGAQLAQVSVPAAANGLQQVRADLSAPYGEAATQDAAAQAAPVMLRNAQLDELLAAHNRAVGGAALQSPGLLRHVSAVDDSQR